MRLVLRFHELAQILIQINSLPLPDRLHRLICILSSWCIVIIVWLFLAVPWVCLQFVIVIFSDRTHLLFLFLYVRDLLLRDKAHVQTQSNNHCQNMHQKSFDLIA